MRCLDCGTEMEHGVALPQAQKSPDVGRQQGITAVRSGSRQNIRGKDHTWD